MIELAEEAAKEIVVVLRLHCLYVQPLLANKRSSRTNGQLALGFG